MKKFELVNPPAGAALSLLTLIFIVGFAPTLNTLMARWLAFDEAYGHGLLIVAISLYLAFGAMNPISWRTGAAPIPVWLLLVSLSIAWALAQISAITIIQELLLPIILLLAIWTLIGGDGTKHLAFPVLMLYFAIPFWDFINDTLVAMTIFVVRLLLPFLGISTLVEGNAFHIPEGTIIVADGCSGLRYLVTGCALSTLAAKLNFSKARQRLALIALGIALSLIANWFRVLSLVLIGHYSQMQSPLMHHHDHYGWGVFLVIITPLFALSERGPSSAAPDRPGNTQTVRWRLLLLTASAMLLGPLLATKVTQAPPHDFSVRITSPTSREARPYEPAWTATLPPPYRFSGATFSDDKLFTTVSVYAYRKDINHEKLLPYISDIYNSEKWRAISNKVEKLDTPTGSISINQLVLKKAQDTHLIWYWFDVGGQRTASYALAKLSQTFALIRSKNHAVVVIVDGRCTDARCDDQEKLMRNIVLQTDLSAKQLISH